ncbi:Voltage-dependent calcium channel gamma-5 subunit [Bulinus truncatus]|nr:Voltage-dependent calcium channel gamma-5 subunit [Bulinus truncatus]
MKLLTVYKLTVLSFVLGAVSVGLFALAVSTDAWLTTREKFSTNMMQENQTQDITYWILVWTGLWRFCIMSEAQPDTVACMAVSYEVQGTGRGENNALTSFTIIGKGVHGVANRGVHVVANRGVHVVANKGIHVVANRGVHVMAYRGVHVVANRGVHVVANRGVHVVANRGVHVVANRGVHVVANRGVHVVANRGVHVVANRGVHVVANRGVHVVANRGVHVVANRAVARRSVALPVSSLILSVVAVTFTVVGNIRKNAKTLVGGVFFILSGLSLAVGMILYISAVNDEVGYRVSTSKNEGEFSYAYGWSFFTAGLGFLASEMAAVVTVTLFMKRNSKFEDMAKIIPGLEDKLIPDGPDKVKSYAFKSVPDEDEHFLCRSEQTSKDRKFTFCGGARNLSVTA